MHFYSMARELTGSRGGRGGSPSGVSRGLGSGGCWSEGSQLKAPHLVKKHHSPAAELEEAQAASAEAVQTQSQRSTPQARKSRNLPAAAELEEAQAASASALEDEAQATSASALETEEAEA